MDGLSFGGFVFGIAATAVKPPATAAFPPVASKTRNAREYDTVMSEEEIRGYVATRDPFAPVSEDGDAGIVGLFDLPPDK